MASAEEAVALTQHTTALFQQIQQYPWESDEEFKNGLAAILGQDLSPEQLAELTTRARCFYYSRKFNTPVDFDAFKSWNEQGTKETAVSANGDLPTGSALAPEPGPKFSYQEIVEMIQSGKPIPGIKEIPPTILEGQGTTSTTSRRKKPWEKDQATEEPNNVPEAI